MPIAERLAEERKRLGLSQTEFAALGGVGRKTQFNYESGERSPDAEYLAAVSGAGVDVLYVVTGKHAGGAAPPPALRDGEATLLEGFRALDARGKAGVMALIAGMGAPAAPRKLVQRHEGDGGVQYGYVGNIHQAPAPQVPPKGKRK